MVEDDIIMVLLFIYYTLFLIRSVCLCFIGPDHSILLPIRWSLRYVSPHGT